MTVWGITRSKNESDVIRPSILRMLDQVDHVLIGDGSTPGEGTREQLDAMEAEGLAIMVVDDADLNWRQREVMTDYATFALERGAEWVVCFDIDEAWSAPGFPRIADVLVDMPPDILIVPALNWTHSATALDDPEDPDPMSRMQWRSPDPLPLAKVACRTRADLRIEHGNHAASYDGPAGRATFGYLEARHFPYRTPEQFIKRVKGAWPSLRDSGLPESHGAHMWAYGRVLVEGGEERLREWFASGMWFEDPEGSGLVLDPARGLSEVAVATIDG